MECFSLGCITACNQMNSHAIFRADMSAPSWDNFLAPVHSWHSLQAFFPGKCGGPFLLPYIKKKNQHLLSFYINILQIIPVLPYLKILHYFRHIWNDLHVYTWLHVRIVIAPDKLHLKSDDLKTLFLMWSCELQVHLITLETCLWQHDSDMYFPVSFFLSS